MTDHSRTACASKPARLPEKAGLDTLALIRLLILIVLAAILTAVYRRGAMEMYRTWTMEGSYYSHGFLVPIISLGVIWIRRAWIFEITGDTRMGWGMVWLVGGLMLLLIGDFLGFLVFNNASMIPVLIGLSLMAIGKTATQRMWFAFAFLLFMVPIPPSLTASVTLHLKLTAAELAVRLARLFTLPMIREGSYIHFSNGVVQDQLLVGDVCGGLRSLISLLAVGALVSYFSRTRPWARLFLLVMSVPIAIVANVVRIFLLCVVGYFWGSEVAAGTVHDVSGILIYVVAFGLFFALEAWLRRLAPDAAEPEAKETSEVSASAATPRPRRRRLVINGATAVVLLVLVMFTQAAIVDAQAAREIPPTEPDFLLEIPSQVGRFQQVGEDVPIEDTIKRKLETSQMLFRNYMSPDGWPVQLTIVYAGKTRRSLHFPEVCLVGDGWDVLKQEKAPVGIMFQAKRLVLVKGDQRQAVLYWFKTGDTLTGSYFLNAYYWARNQLFRGSPTSAMIKLTAPIPSGSGGEEAAFAMLEDFGMRFAPIALERVP